MKGIEYYNGEKVRRESTKKEDVFLEMATSISKLSKDIKTHVGSVIVDHEGKVVSVGYNGCPQNFGVCNGKTDSIVPHSKHKETITLNTSYVEIGLTYIKGEYSKHPFMIHSEQNAIITTSDKKRLVDATIYVTHYPCNVCANLIAQSGIKKVVIYDNKHSGFADTIIPVLFVFENMDIRLSVFGV